LLPMPCRRATLVTCRWQVFTKHKAMISHEPG
jgi:hypothetical protein